MSEIRLTIDGREVTGLEGQSILDIARENGVSIPTLCHDERVEAYGSCGLCVVEAEGSPKLLRACSTRAANGMLIHTNTERTRQNRRTALELLLSDHTGDCRPPCVIACPAQCDCQGYAGLIANGEYREALSLIKEAIPLPSSIGRVCPHPCEEACRRELVEEPVSIAALKRFAGDVELARDEVYMPDAASATGKSVGIIGGGPGGLTAAYFLRAMGHGVTVYEAMPQMGGMLRYGIPEYRLPKELLQAEINVIQKMGTELRNNVKIGRDVTLEHIRGAHNAVIVAVGAWSSVDLRCPGETLDGVLGGIDFLREVMTGQPDYKGRRVAVVGGGNTAMDACRTAVRLGAAEVYNIYRRTKNEMPAEEIEIIEAEEEGVIFKNLTNPIEVIGDGRRVAAIRLQIMELGEADASGRRTPIPIPGKEETIEVDAVIVAIGQKLAPEGLEGIEQTKRGTISVDENTFRTSLNGVFAIGDATNRGADIAVTAMGEAKRAAVIVDKYLNGEELLYNPPYLVKTEKTAEDFADKAREVRIRSRVRPAGERRNDFLEIDPGLTAEQAKREASRCLECGCMDYFECKLIDYANQYRVRPEKYAGRVHRRETAEDHPFIRRNPDKCILCGLCARICDEVAGATGLGLVSRGFDTEIKPAMGWALRDTDCISCGLCVDVCPTGALTEAMMITKQVPIRETITETVCSFCSVGCKSQLTSRGDLLVRNLPEKNALLCAKGRFGFGEIAKKRLTTPMLRQGGDFKQVAFEQAIDYANKSLIDIRERYGRDCVAVAISERYTNEEAFLIKEYANKAIGTSRVFSFGRADSGLEEVFGRDASTAAISDIDGAGLIVVVASELFGDYAVAGMRIRQAVNKGARLMLLSDEESLLAPFAELRLGTGDYLTLLTQITKALLDGRCGGFIPGCGELAASLKDVTVGEQARTAADMILQSDTVFIFERDAVTRQGAQLIADIALLSGGGVIRLLPGANSQGLIDLGVESGEDYRRAIMDGEIRGLFIFGEDVNDIDLSGLDFLAVQDLHMTEAARAAGIVFPASSFAEVKGSYTAADGIVRGVTPAVTGPLGDWDSFAQIMELCANAGAPLPYRRIEDVVMRIDSSKPSAVRLAAAQGKILRRIAPDAVNELNTSFMQNNT